MAEDFRRTSSKTWLPLNHEGSTSFILFNESEEQDGSKSEEHNAVTNDDENFISGQSSDRSSRICTTPEEESIPASVKELLNLLVNRAAQNQSDGSLTKEERQLTDGSGKVHLQDESWTSSMATPSKYNSTAIEANDSTLVNFKFETSDLDVPEDKAVITHATSVDIPTEEGVRTTPSNCILSRKDDPDSTLVSIPNNSFLEPEPILSHNSKQVDNLSTVNSRNKELNIDCPSAIDCPDNSLLDDVINISVGDECTDIGTSFLMSTPVKERSNLKINFNLRKYSFASVSLPSVNDVDNTSVLGENSEGNRSKANKDTSKLSQNDVSEENLDIFDSNSQSLLKNITPVFKTYPNPQEMSYKINVGDFLSVTDEISSCDVAEKDSNCLNSPSKKIYKKACSPLSFDTEPVSESVNCENGLSDKGVSSHDLTCEMATVLICDSKADVERDLFESSHSSSMKSVMTIVRDARRSLSDEASFKNTISVCNTQNISTPASEDRALIDREICCGQNKVCASDTEEVVLMNDNRSVSLGTCEKDMLSIHDGKENAAQVIEDDRFSDYDHANAESASCSAESMKTVITCYNRSTDSVHCASPISGVEGGIPSVEGNTNNSQQESNGEQFLCCTDLMQTVPVNDANIMSTVTQDHGRDLKSILFSESNLNSSEQVEAVSIDDCCLSVKDIECNSRKLPADIGNTEMEFGIRNTPIEILTPIESLKGEEYGMKCVITDTNSKEDECKSGINDDKGQLNVMREDINGDGCFFPKLQQVCSSKDQTIKHQIGNIVDREDPTNGNEAFLPGTSRSQNAEVESNLKILKASEGYTSTNLEKTEFDAELEKEKALDSAFVDKDEISPCKPVSIVSDVDDFQKKVVQINNETAKSPELDGWNGAFQREESSHCSNFCEEGFTGKDLKVNGKNQLSTQRDKNEINHDDHKPDPKSSKEELMEYELNSSIMDNFFSETMDFECDKIAMQTQASAIQNPLGNCGDIFCEPKGQSEASAVRDPDGDHDVVMKTETQEAYTSPSQDFLPSSVLEEVCQATEALVYRGKGKNGCQFDCGMENELLYSYLDNFEADEGIGVERKAENDEGLKRSESDITNCSKDQSFMSKSPGNATVTKTEPDHEEECIVEEEKSKKNLRKKILFTASECITSDEDIEVKIRANNEVKSIGQENESIKAQGGSFTEKMNQIPECTMEDNSVVSKGKETSEVRLSPAKAFIYPKQGKKINRLIQGKVHVEDLMASAVALEKCNKFLPKSKSSEIQKLKNESLICFNSLEASLNEITNQNANNSLHSNCMDAGDHLEQFKRQTSNAKEDLGINQLNDDNGDVSFLLAAVKSEQMLLKPEVSASNHLENEITTSSNIKTVTESIHSKSAQVCASTLLENETMRCNTRDIFSDSVLCKSGENLEISEPERKGHREAESKDEQCTSPILRKGISSRRNFRRRGQVQDKPLTPHNESNIEKSEDIHNNSERGNVIFPENTVSLSLREKKEESHSMNSVCEAGLRLQNNASNVTKNVEEASKLPALNTEEDLFYDGDSIFMSSNLEFAIANEGKTVPENEWVQSKDLSVKEDSNSGKVDQYPDKTEEKNFGKSSETEHIQENILGDNSTLFSSSIGKNVLHEKFILRDDLSTSVASVTAECKSTIGNMNTVSGNLSPKELKMLSGENFSELSYSVINGGGKSKEVVLESIPKEVRQTESVQRDKILLDENHPNEFYFTASGKKLSDSEEAIIKPEKLYSEEPIENSGEIFTGLDNKVLNLKEECKIKTEALSELRKVKPNSFLVSGSKKELFSKKSLSITKRSIIGSDTPSRTESVGFSTASGKKVSVSEKALTNAQKLFSEETSNTSGDLSKPTDHEKDSSMHKRQTNQGLPMCTSARISEEELIQARELFSEEITSVVQNFNRDVTTNENFATSRDLDGPEFSTASGKKVSFSKKSLMDAQKLFSEETKCAMVDYHKDDVINENVTPVRNTDQYGFSTGSGKRVQVSRRALMNAQKMFSEMNDSAIQDLQASKPVIENLTPDRCMDGFEFSTANGEKVSVSRKALLQVQNPSSRETKTENQNFIKDEANNENILASRRMDGFSTGSGKRIAVSKKALLQAQNLYSEISDSPTKKVLKDQVVNEIITPSRSTDRHGFLSASDKKVSLSKRAMLLPPKFPSAASNTTIQEITKDRVSSDDKLPSRKIVEIGVSETINEKVIDPRYKMIRVHNLLSEEIKPEIGNFQMKEETDDNVAVSSSSSDVGFSTGSGKKIAISKNSLMQAKNLFSETSGSIENELPGDQTTNDNVTPARSAFEGGFSTGSGRRVTVSKKAMMQAQNLFSETSGLIEDEHPGDQTTNDNVTPARSAFEGGFSTGSGRRVTVSEKAMMQAQKLFSETSAYTKEELPGDQTNNENVTPARSAFEGGFSTGSGRRVTVSKKAMMRAQNLFSETSGSIEDELPGDQTNNENVTPARSAFEGGFSTGSGRRVTVSKKAMMQAQNLFSETSGSTKEDLPSDQTTNDNVTPARSAFEGGFSTGSSRRVTVSEKAMMQAQNLFSETSAYTKEELPGDQTNNENVTPARSAFEGDFSTGSGRRVTVSKKAMMRAQNLFSETSSSTKEDLPSDLTTNENVTQARGAFEGGFSTGSGRRVTVSKKAMMQAQNLFSETSGLIEDEHPGDQTTNDNVTPARSAFEGGFSTGSGRRVTVSKKAMMRAENLFAETSGFSKEVLPGDQTTNDNVTPARSAFEGGFSTGSGRRVTVFKKAMMQAQNLFSETSGSIEDELPGDQTTNDNVTPARSAFEGGFSTGSGRRVTVSKKAMMQAQNLFSETSGLIEDELPGDQTTNDNVIPARSAFEGGFSTGSGRRVTVSKKAMMRAENLFAETSGFSKEVLPSDQTTNEIATPARNTDGFGFSTGSGNKIQVSKKALEQAQKIFSEEQDSKMKDLQKDEVTNENAISAYNEFGFSIASGKKVTVSKKALLQAHKLYSEVSNSAMQDLQKNISSNKNEITATPEFGFSSTSGMNVVVSEKSLLKAKNNVLEDNSSRLDTKMGRASCSKKGSGLSVAQCFEDSLHMTQNSVTIDNKDRIVLEVSSCSEKRFASPAKSLSLAKKVCLEGPTSVSFGFSTAGGREVPVTEKALIHSKKLLDEESNIVQGNSLSKLSSEIDKVLSDETHINAEQALSEHYLHQRGVTESPIFSKISSRRSLSMARKLFAEESLSVKPEYHIQETTLAKKFVDSPDIVKKSASVNIPVDGATPLSVKSVIKNKNLRKNSIHFEKRNIIQKLDIEQKASVLESAKFNVDDDSKNISFAAKNENRKKFALNETFSTPCDESQGDNYIKAVDLAMLDSSSSIEYPTSPVLKRTNRRRQRFKAVPSSQIKGKESISITSNVSISSTNNNIPMDSLSEKSMQSPYDINHKDESNLRDKEIDLWGTDLAEESWLGKQLDLAEASNQLVATSFKGDIWNAARERQTEVISSKKNVRPIVGKHLQERRKGSLLKSSLNDLVKGKRPGRYFKGELRKFNVRESTLKVTAKNAAEFQFFLKDHYGESIKPSGVTVEDGIVLVPNSVGKFGADEAQAALLAAPGVDPSLLPPGGWCQNHFRWIVWKLACSERSFPEELGGRYFTPENVMRQLKYRWDREIDGGERPALRKILEMDDIASKRIVLCISSIEKPENIQSSNKLELDLISSSTKLELTDGWYAIRGIIDADMAALIQKGKLSVGTKIITSGAELVNGPSNGCHPLEPPAAKAAIRLNTNSTRRARWDVKLGYVCKNPGPLPVSLGSLLAGGGAVSALRNVMLARVYPILNVEKTSDGRKVVRSQKVEARVAAKFERQRQMWLENIYSQVSAEIQKEEEEEAKLTRQGKRTRSEQSISIHNSKRPKRNLAVDVKGSGVHGTLSPEDLLKLMEESEDSSSFQSLLTSSQMKLVMDYKQEERERQQRELEERVRQRIKEEEEKASTPGKSNSSVASSGFSGGNIKRDVVTVLKARLVDADHPVLSKSAVLTVWRPSEEVISLLAKEGVTLNLYNLSSNGMRSSFLQLSSTRQTRYKVNTHLARKMDRYPSLQRVILSQAFDEYIYQRVSKVGAASDCMPPFGEIDLVAMVIKIGDEPEKGKGVGYQHVFVAGSDGSLLSLAFWGGIMEFALDDVLVRGVTIVATNLQWRRQHVLARLPTVHAVETSNFSQHPGEERLKNALRKFEAELKNEMQLVANKTSSKSDFLSYCEEKLAAVTGLGNKTDISPKALATPNNSVKLDLPLNSPTERLVPLRPSVASRMKKLQMYEGAAEISLPVCHVKASPSAMKTFQPPARFVPSKLSKTDNQASELMHSDSNSSPMSLDSDL